MTTVNQDFDTETYKNTLLGKKRKNKVWQGKGKGKGEGD